jgi:hypothetical protein
MEIHPSSPMSKKKCQTYCCGSIVFLGSAHDANLSLLDVSEVVCAAANSDVGTPFPNGTLALVPNVVPNNVL